VFIELHVSIHDKRHSTDKTPSQQVSSSCATKVLSSVKKVLNILEVQLLKIYYISENILYQFSTKQRMKVTLGF
jgi:hypothetical protein